MTKSTLRRVHRAFALALLVLGLLTLGQQGYLLVVYRQWSTTWVLIGSQWIIFAWLSKKTADFL